MKRRRFLWLGAALSITTAAGQVKQRSPRLGVVVDIMSVADFRSGAKGYWPGLERGLRKRGWVEGQNLELHVRSIDGDDSRAEVVVRELISMPIDVLNVNGAAFAAAARLTRTIPIVHHMVGFRRDVRAPLPPNVTGVNVVPADELLEPKMLALLKEIKPSISRIAFVGSPENLALLTQSEVMVAARMGITLSVTNIKSLHHPEADLDEALRQGVEGLMIYDGLDIRSSPDAQRAIHEWARRHRIPAIHWFLSAADSGGLMALAIPSGVVEDRLAYLIDRILRGAKPSDLPVEDPTDLQLVINLGAAEAIGLEVPPSLRIQAARLIK